ncbi:MAG: hypothetical protein PHV30_04615 [Candidatus Margulisbacteria bacterium]|nr:hypothetical protein [Candidatus Margulisiibacteriota bacterium]
MIDKTKNIEKYFKHIRSATPSADLKYRIMNRITENQQTKILFKPLFMATAVFLLVCSFSLLSSPYKQLTAESYVYHLYQPKSYFEHLILSGKMSDEFTMMTMMYEL